MRRGTVKITVKTLIPLLLLMCTLDVSATQPPPCEELFNLRQALTEDLSEAVRRDFDPKAREEIEDLLDFERRVLKFLDEAPEAAFDAIGTNFSVAALSDHADYESRLGINDLELVRRETILKKTRVGMSDSDWESVSEFYADREVYRFLVTALTALPVGTNAHRKPVSISQIRQGVLLYWNRYRNQSPSAESMLTTSRLMQEAFVRSARVKDKSFRLDLSEPKNQRLAIKMLNAKKFGSPEKFMLTWLAEAYIGSSNYAADFLLQQGKSLGDYYGMKVEDQISLFEIKNEDEYIPFEDSGVGNFIARLVFTISLPNPFYSREEVRKTLNQALIDHHEILRELLVSEEKRFSELRASNFDFQYVHKFDYEPASTDQQTEVDKENLNSYATQHLPLDALQPEHDYKVVFKKDFGLRRKVFIVRFTARGLNELRKWQNKKYHGVTAASWLGALQIGFAAKYGESGIKLLKTSPIQALPHLELEVKIPAIGPRWLGFVDDDGRFVFDLFHNEHS